MCAYAEICISLHDKYDYMDNKRSSEMSIRKANANK